MSHKQKDSTYPDEAMLSFDFLPRLEADKVGGVLLSECLARLICRAGAALSSSFPPPTLRLLVDALRFRPAGADLALEAVDVAVTGDFCSFGFVVDSMLDNDAEVADCLAEERVTLDDMRNFFLNLWV